MLVFTMISPWPLNSGRFTGTEYHIPILPRTKLCYSLRRLCSMSNRWSEYNMACLPQEAAGEGKKQMGKTLAEYNIFFLF